MASDTLASGIWFYLIENNIKQLIDNIYILVILFTQPFRSGRIWHKVKF